MFLCFVLSFFLCLREQARTSRDNIIHHQHSLARGDGVLLDLEEVLTVLLLERRLLGRTWQLSWLAHRSKARTQSQSQRGAEEEAAGVKANDHIGSLAMVELADL